MKTMDTIVFIALGLGIGNFISDMGNSRKIAKVEKDINAVSMRVMDVSYRNEAWITMGTNSLYVIDQAIGVLSRRTADLNDRVNMIELSETVAE